MGLSFVSRRALTVGAMVVAGALGLSACGGGGGDTSASPSGAATTGAPAAAGGAPTLVNPGKLTTCTSLPYPPFQYKEGDKVVGFDVEIVDLAAKKLGVTQEIVDIKFDSIKSGAALNAGKCDVAAAGMTITEERKANLDFSDPYFDEVIAFLSPKGKKVNSIEEVKAGNLRFGVQAATTSLDYAKEKGFDPKQFDDAGKQIAALQAGQVDVILQDLPVINDWLKKPEIAEKFELGGVVETGAQYGIAAKKGSADLVKALNEAIAQAKSDGTYDTIYEKWFGKKPGA
ncbi:basic amino acid ABC transporter substrate-binding protein [Planobispora rosea]|uniref:Basic amino acid ABC transporter substrate-binding protein n=2 Tax=Planobispora rosea TaxID=35762 RepID=A0A8J3WAA6_PLARO|nr:basic amino acid ABC transporter substrate-binding protein [Planobispora rosea]GIH82594.1 basic amino acid ABC transporter substrate-binding protein [Planobispora rosea]